MKRSNILLSPIILGIFSICCLPLLIFANRPTPVKIQHHTAPDSVGTEVINGEIYIIHEIVRKETYYALSRRYNVPVNGIVSTNGNKKLKPGDRIKVPTGRRANQISSVIQSAATQANTQEQDSVLTDYKVGKKETLYAISKRFNTTVEDIKRMNSLGENELKEGQLIKIPNSDYVRPTPPLEVPIIMESPVADELQDYGFEANRYGIREKKEKGIGVWIDNLESDGKSNLALHRTAPVGTILKITNPMTKNVTYAKVVGRFKENADTRDAIVVLSKSAASYIGALDRRFLIEIAYGVPLQ